MLAESCSKASGIKCKKAPPMKVPAEREIKHKITLSPIVFLVIKNTTPLKEPKLIKSEAIII